MIVAGIDEAGYGPVLGPLVISASAFSLEGRLDPADVSVAGALAKKLRSAITTRPPVRGGKLIIADSKLVYRLSGGLAHLERAVLAVARLLPNAHPEAFRRREDLMRLCGQESPNAGALHWYAHDQRALPRFCQEGGVDIAANLLRGAMAGAGIGLAGLWARVVDEAEFNRLAGAAANKAAVLAGFTMAHLWNLHQRFGEDGLMAVIDKQGARDHYVPLLLRTFPGAALKVIDETHQQSSYLVREGSRQSFLIFREKAENACMATALASMLCKYLRELFMDSFNSWWTLKIPDLVPTAGYYSDAQRWLSQAAGHFQRLGVNPENLIRVR